MAWCRDGSVLVVYLDYAKEGGSQMKIVITQTRECVVDTNSWRGILGVDDPDEAIALLLYNSNTWVAIAAAISGWTQTSLEIRISDPLS